MCLLCVEYEAKRMTGWEVDRAGLELVFTSDGKQIQHLQELIDKVRKDRMEGEKSQD